MRFPRHAPCPMLCAHALCPMLHTLCSVPYALCPIPCAQYPIPHSAFRLPHSKCPIPNYSPYSICPMLYAPCSMPFALCPMPSTHYPYLPNFHSRNSVAGGCRKTIFMAGRAARAVRIIKGSDMPNAPQSTPYRNVQPNDCRLITYTSK